MSQRSINKYLYREALKELRLRIETTDPHFRGLKKLRMRGKELQDLPMAMFGILELEVLDLSPNRESCLDYRMTSVPPQISKLVNLRVLMLDTNDLYSLPKEISLLLNLERLSLSNNHLTSLPPGFQRLNKLRSLHAANNNFETLPLEICELPSLEFLDLSDNVLINLPEQIGNIKTLSTLLLLYNKLIKLPDSICALSELECLWLGGNKLKELPRDFGKLSRLHWGAHYTSSILEGNPLTFPPIEVCRLGPKAIDTYFTVDEKEELQHFSDEEVADEHERNIIHDTNKREDDDYILN